MEKPHEDKESEKRQKVFATLNNLYRDLPDDVGFFCDVEGGSWSIIVKRDRTHKVVRI